MFGPIVLRVLPYVGVFLAALALGWQVNGWRLNTKIESIQAEYARQYAAAQQQAREKEQSMQAAADQLRRTKDDQIRTLGLAPLLLSCAIAPKDPPPVPLPRMPVLDLLPKDVVEPSFIERMESFLSGKLPEQTQSERGTSSVPSSTKP